MIEKLKNIREDNVEKVIAEVVKTMEIEENYGFDIMPSISKIEIVVYPLVLGKSKTELNIDLIGGQFEVVNCKYGDEVTEEDLMEIEMQFERELGKAGA